MLGGIDKEKKYKNQENLNTPNSNLTVVKIFDVQHIWLAHQVHCTGQNQNQYHHGDHQTHKCSQARIMHHQEGEIKNI